MSTNDENLDFNTIRNFWKEQSSKSDNRWTDRSFLDFEIGQIKNITDGTPIKKILDLGSGTGTLSKKLVGEESTLDAVDFEDSYEKSFEGDRRFTFIKSDVRFFKTSSGYDLILFFGVTTYLDIESEEIALNSICEMLNESGVAVIKLQCSDSGSFFFNGFSVELGMEYSGRYPSRQEQRKRLLTYFTSVEEVLYPVEMKRHSNTSHVMFICRRNTNSFDE